MEPVSPTPTTPSVWTRLRALRKPICLGIIYTVSMVVWLFIGGLLITGLKKQDDEATTTYLLLILIYIAVVVVCDNIGGATIKHEYWRWFKIVLFVSAYLGLFGGIMWTVISGSWRCSSTCVIIGGELLVLIIYCIGRSIYYCKQKDKLRMNFCHFIRGTTPTSTTPNTSEPEKGLMNTTEDE